jgi:Helix-turn-helix domain
MPESHASRGARRGRRLLADLGVEIRDARRSAGLSLGAVAAAGDVSPSELSRIERGLARGWTSSSQEGSVRSWDSISLFAHIQEANRSGMLPMLDSQPPFALGWARRSVSGARFQLAINAIREPGIRQSPTRRGQRPLSSKLGSRTLRH